jgi:glycosyltransferase involved in cell wall biosynthesis
MKTIWLVNYYAMPPKLESRLRTIKFAYYLKKQGYTVRIIGSSAMHNKEINLIEGNCRFIETSYDGIDFIHIKTLSYRNNGVFRFLSLLVFHFRLHILRKRFPRPDVLIHTALPPFGNVTFFTARSLGAKYIVEVLDLWPESFVAFGLISRGNPLLALAYWAERWLYTKADEVVFSMEGGRDYIMDKKWDIDSGGRINLKKVHYINNGVDIAEFDYYKENFEFEDTDLLDDSFRVVYLGSIRLANNIRLLLDAAINLESADNIKFLIYGDGEERVSLENYCKLKSISNVVFKEKWIDPKYVPFVLSRSSLNILNYRPNSVEKYGGSQSKLFQYLASGKPICSNLEYGNSLVANHNLGISRSFASPEDYAEAILSISRMGKSDYDRICVKSREVAEQFDYQLLTMKLQKLL